jgi:hypothetical protein
MAYAESGTETADSESGSIRQPVRVEELITSPQKWTFDTSISYVNVNRSSGKSGVMIISTLTQQYTVPYYLGDEEINEDLIGYMVNIRYGLTKTLEVFTFGSAFSDFQRISLAGERETYSDHDFNVAGVGATYQIRKEDKYPAMLISASANVAENTRFSGDSEMNKFKSFSTSLTSYHTVDPVIFLVQAAYQYNKEREVDDTVIDPGSLLSLSPQILFVVNPFVTLAGGFKCTMQSRAKINGETLSSARTDVSPVMGFSYGITDNKILSFDTEFKNQADYDQSTVSLRLISRF